MKAISLSCLSGSRYRIADQISRSRAVLSPAAFWFLIFFVP